MKKIFCYLLVVVGIMAFAGCGSDEDVSPSNVDANLFAPKEDDQSAEATLRRGFFEQTGSYLLFNDTLSKVSSGSDEYGHPLYDVKTVDVDFSMIGSSSDYYRYTYDYIDDDAAKQKAAQYIKEKILGKLGPLTPYSVLLVNSMTQWRSSNGQYVMTKNPHPVYRLGVRCYAFSLDNGSAYEDADYYKTALQSIVYNKISTSKYSAQIAAFQNLMPDFAKYTSTSKYDLGLEEEIDHDLARSLGFMRDNNWYYFFSASRDLQTYVEAEFNYTVPQFEEAYADYPICIARFNALRQILLDAGVKLD